MQRATPAVRVAAGPSSQGPEAAAGTGSAAENASPSDKSIKGPPLASRSHIVQILVMLSLNSFLLFMCLFVLPAHLLWRQALKKHQLIEFEATTANATATAPINSLLLDTVKAGVGNSTSTTRNIFTAFKILFTVTNKDTVALAGIRRAFRSCLAAVLLSQAWFIARYKGWWDEAEAMERGDRDEVLKRRKIGIYTRMEDVTVASFAMPIPIVFVYLLLTLCGAPITSNHLDTLILAAYLSLFMFFSSCTFLGTDEREWIDAFALSAKSTPRFKLLATQVTCTLVGALVGSAGHLLDWEKAWQVYPVPTILGSCLGLIVGNGIGFFSYYRAVSSTSRRVELRASSASAPSSSKGKNKNNKKKKR